MKTFKGLALAAVVCMSSQAFSSNTVRNLNCGDLESNRGVGYRVQISSGFDTHARNPDGTIGVSWGPAFRLVSQVVSPVAQPSYEDLKLQGRTNGNYDLVGQHESATVNASLSKAVVKFNNGATATCD